MNPFRPPATFQSAVLSRPVRSTNMCCDELRGDRPPAQFTGTYSHRPLHRKAFRVYPQYEDLPDGVLGFTRFGKNGVTAVVISAALDAKGGKIAERRVRTTIAHEGGHGLLHAHLFALDDIPLHLFDKDSHSGDQILCRDVHGDEKKAHRYDGRWWEVQANRAMSSLLCPRPLVLEAMTPYFSRRWDCSGWKCSPKNAARKRCDLWQKYSM